MSISAISEAGRDKIVVLSSDIIGDTMAGPGIRYLRMAEALSSCYPTVLAAPCEIPTRLVPCPTFNTRSTSLARVISNASLVITQGFNVSLRTLLTSRCRLIIDLYDPVGFEVLGMMGDQGKGTIEQDLLVEQDLLLSWTNHKINLLLLSGDHFLCATERQRALWLGNLLALGRLNRDLLEGDANADRLMTILPFGIDNREFPQTEKGVFRRNRFGISSEDVLFYWGGGMWDWLDPVTAVKAIAHTSTTHPHIKLLFLAGVHPNVDIPTMTLARTCRELAAELGIIDRYVFFLDEWIPFEQRHIWLGEADVGISLHPSSLETTFSFRTRLLDYLWAGLPLLVTSGDALSDELSSAGAGLTVKPGDVNGLAEAMRQLAHDATKRQHMGELSRDHSRGYRWADLLERLVDAVETSLSRPIQRNYRLVRQRLIAFYLRNFIEEFRYRGIVPTIKKRMSGPGR